MKIESVGPALVAGWLAGALLASVLPTAAAAQANPVHTHIGHVTTSFPGAPNAQGLLATALAEANTAAQHADLASNDLSNLTAIRTHAGHVLHALSPAEGAQGPGQGFGVQRGAEAVSTHIGLAAGTAGASQNVTTHAAHITASAGTVAGWAAEAADVATRTQAAGTAADAAPLVEQLKTLTNRILVGYDANGDGRIGWEAGEGGLAQVEQHVGLLVSAEGL